jgi:ribonuclease R
MKKKNRKEKTNKKQSLPLKSKILKIFRQDPKKSFNHEQISIILKAHSSKINVLISEILLHLDAEGVLQVDEYEVYTLKVNPSKAISKQKPSFKKTGDRIIQTKDKLRKIEERSDWAESKPEANSSKDKTQKQKKAGSVGRISFTQRGVAYVIIDEVEKDTFIHKGKTGKALNGDLVEIKIKQFKGKPESEVISVVERARDTFVGTVDQSDKATFVVPDDKNMPADFYINRSDTEGAKTGEKVIVKLISWPEQSNNPVGKIIDVLGLPGSKNVDMHSILAENGLPYKFPPQVLSESESIANGDYSSTEDRRDMRDTLTFTIDPVDAKDFDDALSFKKLDNGNIEVGIHIADVSHFVKPGSSLDKEAYERGNSVYLVDRVVPMLPEVLSNKLCSLRPNEEKLTFSAIFELDNNAKIVNEWFGKTVIFSDQRFAYEEAQEIIEGKEDPKFGKAVLTLDKYAKVLRNKRLEVGALNIESEEVRFELNSEGHPIGLMLKISKCANKLIEEFMLLANRRVAFFVGKSKDEKNPTPFAYRVHAEPNPEKIADLEIFLQQFGYVIERVEKKPLASALNNILEEAKEKDELHIIGPMVIRSMSKAIYDIKNIGHYGLAFEHYTHFTSPIRRYADLLVHRVLFAKLKNTKFKGGSELKTQCEHISATEKNAAKAERASTKFMQVKYMADKIGNIYEGIITGVTEWGVFVEIIETKCEGLVHISSLDGNFSINDKTKKLESIKSGESYHLGQKVKVSVQRVNELKKQIDLLLSEI